MLTHQILVISQSFDNIDDATIKLSNTLLKKPHEQITPNMITYQVKSIDNESILKFMHITTDTVDMSIISNYMKSTKVCILLNNQNIPKKTYDKLTEIIADFDVIKIDQPDSNRLPDNFWQSVEDGIKRYDEIQQEKKLQKESDDCKCCRNECDECKSMETEEPPLLPPRITTNTIFDATRTDNDSIFDATISNKFFGLFKPNGNHVDDNKNADKIIYNSDIFNSYSV